MGLYAIPGISFYGGSQNGTSIGPNLSGPAVFVDNTFDYDDSVMINKGKHSIAVGGINSDGTLWFGSNPGANLLVSAGASGVTSTSVSLGTHGAYIGDYTDGFGGTSSAAPMVTGV